MLSLLWPFYSKAPAERRFTSTGRPQAIRSRLSCHLSFLSGRTLACWFVCSVLLSYASQWRACLWPHAFRTGYTPTYDLFVSACLFVCSASHCRMLPSGKMYLWSHAFRTRYTCTSDLFVSAHLFVQSHVFVCFPVEKRACRLTLLQRDIHAYLTYL